jgi:hypothetical protein
MKFGLYLTRKSAITAEQLVAALEYQQKKLVPIGQLALEECFLSAPEVFQVLRCQSDMPHERFGELAVSLGLLAEEELQRLLVIQSNRQMPLADVLVIQGALTPAQAEQELAEYRRELERNSAVIKRRIPTTPKLPPLPDLPVAAEAEVDVYATTM